MGGASRILKALCGDTTADKLTTHTHDRSVAFMQFWLRLADGIDRLSEWTGRFVYWLTLIMVLVGAFNAVARYLDRSTGLGLSSNMYLELQWYLFSIVFLVGAAYTLKYNAHVRVDVLYGQLSRRGKAWVNVLGTLLFLIPFCVLMLWMSWPEIVISWAEREQSPDPGGLPRYPIKTVIIIAFALVLLQGIALLIRQTAVLRGANVDDQSQNVQEMGEGI